MARKEKPSAPPTGNIANLLRFGKLQQQRDQGTSVRDLRKKKIVVDDGLDGLLKGLIENPDLEEGEEEKIVASVAANKSTPARKRKLTDLEEDSTATAAEGPKAAEPVLATSAVPGTSFHERGTELF